MKTLHQSPTDPDFVQNPYPFYEAARATGPFFRWEDYGLICTTSAAACNAIFRDRRFGREVPPELAPKIAPHMAPFYAVEAHSMLELEPPTIPDCARLCCGPSPPGGSMRSPRKSPP